MWDMGPTTPQGTRGLQVPPKGQQNRNCRHKGQAVKLWIKSTTSLERLGVSYLMSGVLGIKFPPILQSLVAKVKPYKPCNTEPGGINTSRCVIAILQPSIVHCCVAEVDFAQYCFWCKTTEQLVWQFRLIFVLTVSSQHYTDDAKNKML